MGALAEFLFPAPAARSAAAIFRWWESRRLHYNLIVGATGLLSTGMVAVISAVPPAASPLPPFLPVIVVYGFLANVCYSAGPLAELFLERMWARRLLPSGPTLFRMGLTFAVGLTLLPVFLAVLDWGRRVLLWIL